MFSNFSKRTINIRVGRGLLLPKVPTDTDLEYQVV